MTACPARWPRRSSKPVAGLTLVEVLVALAICSVILGLVASLLGSARAATASQDRATEPARTLDLAAELLAEEIGLAGYRPWRLAPVETGPEILIASTPNGHSLRVRFVDDRAEGPAVERLLTFEAREDGAGVPQLYRQSGASSRQPLVAGVESLVVEAIVTGAGVALEPAPGSVHVGARGLVLYMAGEDGAQRVVVVPTGSRPTVEVFQ